MIFCFLTKNYLLYLKIICIIVLLQPKQANHSIVYIIISFMRFKFNAFYENLYQGEYNIMENAKKKITLEIASSRVTLVTDEDENYVKKLAAVVTQKVNTLALSGNGITKTDAALVYALGLLDENFKLKVELAELKKDKND